MLRDLQTMSREMRAASVQSCILLGPIPGSLPADINLENFLNKMDGGGLFK